MEQTINNKFLNYVEKKLGEILGDLEEYTNESINAHFKCSDYNKEECRMNFIKGNIIKYQISKLIGRIETEKEMNEIDDILG